MARGSRSMTRKCFSPSSLCSGALTLSAATQPASALLPASAHLAKLSSMPGLPLGSSDGSPRGSSCLPLRDQRRVPAHAHDGTMSDGVSPHALHAVASISFPMTSSHVVPDLGVPCSSTTSSPATISRRLVFFFSSGSARLETRATSMAARRASCLLQGATLKKKAFFAT
tara:strand:- start:1242 stop:1751 length:510 start_codon:yes stop_codon:yes gene_type:complete